jgi:hypothetical protein
VELLVSGIGEMVGLHGLCGIDWVHDPCRDRLSLLGIQSSADHSRCLKVSAFALVKTLNAGSLLARYRHLADYVVNVNAGSQLLQQSFVGTL